MRPAPWPAPAPGTGPLETSHNDERADPAEESRRRQPRAAPSQRSTASVQEGTGRAPLREQGAHWLLRRRNGHANDRRRVPLVERRPRCRTDRVRTLWRPSFPTSRATPRAQDPATRSPPTTSWETRPGRRRLLGEVRPLLAGESHGGGG